MSSLTETSPGIQKRKKLSPNPPPSCLCAAACLTMKSKCLVTNFPGIASKSAGGGSEKCSLQSVQEVRVRSLAASAETLLRLSHVSNLDVGVMSLPGLREQPSRGPALSPAVLERLEPASLRRLQLVAADSGREAPQAAWLPTAPRLLGLPESQALGLQAQEQREKCRRSGCLCF